MPQQLLDQLNAIYRKYALACVHEAYEQAATFKARHDIPMHGTCRPCRDMYEALDDL